MIKYTECESSGGQHEEILACSVNSTSHDFANWCDLRNRSLLGRLTRCGTSEHHSRAHQRGRCVARRFSSRRSCINQLAKLPPLIFVNGCPQILKFGCVFPNKDDERNLRNAGHPGITNELRIESQETIGLFRRWRVWWPLGIRVAIPHGTRASSLQLA